VGEITVKAFAKLNLSLDVKRKRADGYHDVEMIMQTIDLHDTIVIRHYRIDDEDRFNEKRKRINVICDSSCIPSGEENIAYKAANEMYKRYELSGCLDIQITKRIPSSAGLAGGSADAAAVIHGINSLFEIDAGIEELEEIGIGIGADVPFCINGGTMLAEGIGERLTSLPSFEGIDIVLIKPDISISTPWAYKNLDLARIENAPDTKKIIESIKNKDITTLGQSMKNVFESVVCSHYIEIAELKNSLLKNGAIGSIMSGSGSAVFGIFGNAQQARKAYNNLIKTYIKGEQLFLAKTVRGENYGR